MTTNMALLERMILDGSRGEARMKVEGLCRLMNEQHHWPSEKTFRTLRLLTAQYRAKTDRHGYVWLPKRIVQEYEG